MVSKLIFTTVDGNEMVHEGGCFMPLKSGVDLMRVFTLNTVRPSAIGSIVYKLDLPMKLYSRNGKKVMLRYITKLLSDPAIASYKINGVTPLYVLKKGLDLPLTISGSALYVIFSLLRYVVEYPTMVMTIMEYEKVMDFDKALYLAHFTFFNEGEFLKEVPDTSIHYDTRPVNHSVISTVRAYKGGYKFLRETLPVLALLGAYTDTYSYGNIHGVLGVTNGEELDLPTEVTSPAHAAQLSRIL